MRPRVVLKTPGECSAVILKVGLRGRASSGRNNGKQEVSEHMSKVRRGGQRAVGELPLPSSERDEHAKDAVQPSL